jgi:cullin 1
VFGASSKKRKKLVGSDASIRFSELVRVAFNNEPGFVAALDKASRRFLNSNAVAGNLEENGSGSASKSPELLARYCDQLLKKGGKSATDVDVEKMLDDILIVFKVGKKKKTVVVVFVV